MKLLFALPLACALFLSSCAASKNIDTSEHTNYSNELQNIRSSLDSLQWSIERQSQITTDKLSNLKLENTTVYLSVPDSTGKQYPIKQSTTQLNKEEKEHKQEYESLYNSLIQISNRIDSLHNKVNELGNKKEVIKELSWWDLHKDKIYGTLIGLVFIGILLIKLKK